MSTKSSTSTKASKAVKLTEKEMAKSILADLRTKYGVSHKYSNLVAEDNAIYFSMPRKKQRVYNVYVIAVYEGFVYCDIDMIHGLPIRLDLKLLKSKPKKSLDKFISAINNGEYSMFEDLGNAVMNIADSVSEKYLVKLVKDIYNIS